MQVRSQVARGKECILGVGHTPLVRVSPRSAVPVQMYRSPIGKIGTFHTVPVPDRKPSSTTCSASESRMATDLIESATTPSVALRVFNVLAFIFVIVINGLSSIGALGPTNLELSNRWMTPLTPLPYGFAIWGTIFSLQMGGVIYQALNHGYGKGSLKSAAVQAIGPCFAVGWLMEGLWQLFFEFETKPGMILCAVFLAGGLTAFATAMKRLFAVMSAYKAKRGGLSFREPHVLAVVTFFQLSSSINTAWLSAATCLGVLIVPEIFGASQAFVNASAIGCAAAAVVGGVAWIMHASDFAYSATLLWTTLALFPRYIGVPYVPWLQLVVMGVTTALAILSLVPKSPLNKKSGGDNGERSPLLNDSSSPKPLAG